MHGLDQIFGFLMSIAQIVKIQISDNEYHNGLYNKYVTV